MIDVAALLSPGVLAGNRVSLAEALFEQHSRSKASICQTWQGSTAMAPPGDGRPETPAMRSAGPNQGLPLTIFAPAWRTMAVCDRWRHLA